MNPTSSSDLGPELLVSLGRLEGRVEQFLIGEARQNERLDNHSVRLSALENGRAKLLGYAAGAAATVSAFVAAATAIFKG